MFSAGGDAQTLAKSFIRVAECVAHDWYITLRPLSIRSWDQLKSKILATFQGYQPEIKTTRDLMNCVQQDNEPLSDYIKRFIQVKAQATNVPEAAVIVAAIEGVATGQCASYLACSPPKSVTELFTIMNQYAKSDSDYQRRKATQSLTRQAAKMPRPQQQQPPYPQRSIRPFRTINNLQDEPEYGSAETPQQVQGHKSRNFDHPTRNFDHPAHGGRSGRGFHGGREGRGHGERGQDISCAGRMQDILQETVDIRNWQRK